MMKKVLTARGMCGNIIYGLKEPVPKTAGASGPDEGGTPKQDGCLKGTTASRGARKHDLDFIMPLCPCTGVSFIPGRTEGEKENEQES